MYYSIKIESTNPRAANIVDCYSLEEVDRFLYKFISFTKPFSWQDELDIDLSKIETRDMEHNEYMRKQIIDNMMNPCCNEIKFLDNCYVLHSSPCRLTIKKVKLCGKEGEHMYIDESITKNLLKYCETDVKSVSNIYRNFQVTPERVIYNDPATIVFWKDGTKTVVKCTDGDVYNPEVGLAMCVCKKLYDKKYHKFFKYYTKDAPTRPLQGNVTGATDVSYYSPVDEVINLIKAVFDDTRGESK